MLLMFEKGLKGGIWLAIYRFAKANNKYMKDYDKNKKSSNLQHWDINNLYFWAMSQKLPVNECADGYFLKVDFQCPKRLLELHNDLPFLPERLKIEKVEKVVTNLHNKTEMSVALQI